MKRVGLIFKLLATGTLTMMLAACYGTIMTLHNGLYGRRSGVIKVLNPESMPIPGIKISYTTSLEANNPPDSTSWQPLGDGYTDPDGALRYTKYLDAYEILLVMLEDVDAEQNGGPYATLIIPVEDPEKIITMEEIDSMSEEL
jgi:hypothetical protein